MRALAHSLAMGIAMLLLTGCVAGSPSTSNAEATSSGGAFPATATPGTDLYTASVAEGTGPESPLSPAPITLLRVPGPAQSRPRAALRPPCP